MSNDEVVGDAELVRALCRAYHDAPDDDHRPAVSPPDGWSRRTLWVIRRAVNDIMEQRGLAGPHSLSIGEVDVE